jgi:hypothetical protein
MSGLVLRIWVLTLAILFQASNWSSETCSSAKAAVPLVQGGSESNDARDGDSRDRPGRDRDAPEDGKKELSTLDDSSGDDVVPADIPNWCNPPVSDCGYAWMVGLAPGGPPADAPFKPPRA